MTHELVYTSAPQGVRPGSTGYCTVAHTAGLPPDLMDLLEGLSRYRHRTVGDDPDRAANPVSFAHSVVTVGYQKYHVLSRVADTGLDHTGRSNYLAHHIAFDPDHLLPAGPAWLCEQPRTFETAWAGPPEVLPGPRGLPTGSAGPRRCQRWEKATDDAGWAGVLAAATNPAEPAYLVFAPGDDVLGLFAEAMALLPADDRWDVTFNTYFTGGTAGTKCQWRGAPADSPEAREAIAARRGVVIRLDRPMTGEPAGPLVEAARTGSGAAVSSPRRASAAPIPRKQRPAADPLPLSGERPRGKALDLDDREDEPRPDPVRGGRGAVGPLLVGLVLGVLLLLISGSLLEVATGQSLLQNVGLGERKAVVSDPPAAQPVDDLKKELEAARKELQAKEDELRVERKQRQDEKDRRAKERPEPENAISPPRVKPDPPLEPNKGEPAHNDNKSPGKEEMDKIKRENALLKKNKDDLERRIEELKKEKDGQTRETPDHAPNSSLKVFGLDVTLKKGEIQEVFRTGEIPSGSSPKLHVFGPTGGLREKSQPDARSVILEGHDNFKAELSANEDGVVTVKGTNLEQYPHLGLLVLRIDSPNGPSIYRQLFRPEIRPTSFKVSSEVLPKDTQPAANLRRYTINVVEKITGGLKSEVKRHLKEDGPIYPGRSARIKLLDKEYDLRPSAVLNPEVIPTRLEYTSPDKNSIGIRLTIDHEKAVIEVRFPDDVQPPAECELLNFELTRPVQKLPGYVQELLRIGS